MHVRTLWTPGLPIPGEPPASLRSISPPPESLYDSKGQLRALVYAENPGFVEVDGFGRFPSFEFFYDTDHRLRGFHCPEGILTNGGHDENTIYWKLQPNAFAENGPYYALIKFQDPAHSVQEHAPNGQYDRVLELPTAEGMLFFPETIADAVFANKAGAERVQKNGLLITRRHILEHIPDESSPLPPVFSNPEPKSK